MAKVLVTEGYLSDIGDAIRGKLGGSTHYTPGQMASAISSIPTEAATLISKTIASNGTYNASSDEADGYSSVNVNVPNSYSAQDEGKVVSSGALVAQGSQNVSQNGTYDTTLKNQVIVAVPNSYSASDEGKVVSSGELVAQTSRNVTVNGTYDTTTNNEVVVNVSGGGGQTVQSNRNFAVNWDFSNPVNTRGNSSYGSSGQVLTIDGWHVYGGKVTLVTGGLKLEQYSSGTNGFFMQRFTSYVTAQIVGKQFTFSIIVDGELYSDTFTMPSANSGTNGVSAGGVNFRTWNYGNEIALTIDILSDSGSHVVEAVKLEAGDTQTLATKVGNTWVLNDKVNANAEYIMARVVYLTNS